MSAPLVKTKTPGIYKRGGRYVFSYRANSAGTHAGTLDEAVDREQELAQAVLQSGLGLLRWSLST